MAVGVFELLKQEFAKANQTGDLKNVPRHSAAAAAWYADFIKNNITKMNALEGLRSGKRDNKISPGSFYVYSYDPKTKETLPFYDTMPLILCTSVTPNGHYGIAFHYLPPKIRLKIIQEMYKVSKMTSNDNMKFRLSWAKAQQLVHAIGQDKWLKHSIKQYLHSHVKSDMIKVAGDNIEPMLFLPIARWKKATQTEVWRAA